MSATAVITDIVTGVIDKLRGKSDDLTAKVIAKAVAEKVTEAVIAAIAVELQRHANALGLVLATHELADATLEVMQAFETKGRASIASLVDVEIVDKFDTSDAKDGE